jgi:hypothetical protein
MPSAVIPSVHSYPAMQLAPQQVHQRYVHPGPLVLRADPLNSPTPTADRDRTVSRRSKPSSRTTLIGEQPNPWDLLQPQDVMSRHRGAKRCRRYGLLGIISLLSLEYLLSVERWPVHEGPPDHYGVFRLCSRRPSRSQAGLCHCTQQPMSDRLEPTFARLRYSLGGDRPSQTTRHAGSRTGVHPPRLDFHEAKGGISRTAPRELAPPLHSLPPILHITSRKPLQSCSKGSRGLSV